MSAAWQSTPDVGSRERRWAWAERLSFLSVWVVAVPVLVGAAWWVSVLVAIVPCSLGVAIDLLRRRRVDQTARARTLVRHGPRA